VVHASPNAPAVDIVVDNSTPAAVSGLAFPANTGYVGLGAGTRNVKVNVANTATTVINADLTLQAGKNYSVFAIDSVSSIEPSCWKTIFPPRGREGSCAVRAPVTRCAGRRHCGDRRGSGVWRRGFQGVPGFTPLDAGTYNLEVRLAGTPTVVLPLPGITLEAGKIYTVFARGFVGGSGAQALGAEIIVNK